VSLPTKQAVVTYDAHQVTVAHMMAAMQHVGFSARLHQ
jgi:hypothetical protein